MIYIQLFYTFFKIGLFGFGGGYAMLSMIQGEVVTRYGWVSSQEFTDIVAISQMTPGPIGINAATYVGFTSTGSILGFYHCNLRRSPSLLYLNADYQQIFSEISETSSSGINLQRTTASSRRTAGLCRIGINECRELWLTYKRYLYICYQYHHLPDCFYRNEKI